MPNFATISKEQLIDVDQVRNERKTGSVMDTEGSY